MKKRNIIIIAVAVLVIIAAVLLITKPWVTPMPEPATVVIDEEQNITASFGVAEVEEDMEEEEEEPAEPSEKPEKDDDTALAPVTEEDAAPAPDSAPTRTSTQTAASTPAPTATVKPIPEEPAKTSYEVFNELSPEQKDAFMESFGNIEAFYQWLVAAQAEYESQQAAPIEIAPGSSIDLSKLG